MKASRLLIILGFAATITLASCSSHKSDRKERAQIEHTVRPGFHRGQSSANTPEQSKIVEEAYSWIGTPYLHAAAEKGEGTDCSGMVMKVYQDATGKKLPRNSAKQAEFCDKISEEEVQAGDLVFFATGSDAAKVSHVGIMVDKLQFVHASKSKGVCISELSGSYYPPRLLMYGRVP